MMLASIVKEFTQVVTHIQDEDHIRCKTVDTVNEDIDKDLNNYLSKENCYFFSVVALYRFPVYQL